MSHLLAVQLHRIALHRGWTACLRLDHVLVESCGRSVTTVRTVADLDALGCQGVVRPYRPYVPRFSDEQSAPCTPLGCTCGSAEVADV